MAERELSRPLLVLSDLHLSPAGRGEVARDLAGLVRSFPGHEIVLAGDVFDFSTEPRERDLPASVAQMLRTHQDLVPALRDHLRAGSGLTLIAGNHDAAAATPAARRA